MVVLLFVWSLCGCVDLWLRCLLVLTVVLRVLVALLIVLVFRYSLLVLRLVWCFVLGIVWLFGCLLGIGYAFCYGFGCVGYYYRLNL